MTALDLLRPHTSHNAQQRGGDYLEQVDIVSGSADAVRARVRGTGIYEVRLRKVGADLRVWCTCPYFSDRANACKHMWATAVRADDNGWLSDLPGGTRVVMDVKDLEDHELSLAPRGFSPSRDSNPVPRYAAPPKPPDWEIALSGVRAQRPEGLPAASQDSHLLYILTVSPRATVTEVPLTVEKRDRKRDGDWGKPQPSRLTMSSIPYLPDPDDRWAL